MGCRATDDQSALVRLVWTPEGPAIDRTAPGRGAWLHPGCGARAVKRRAIARALRRDAGTPDQLAALAEQVDALAPRLGKSGDDALD